MSKPSTNLANLIPSRIAPRPMAVEASSAPAPEPAATTRRRQPSRTKTVMIAGHFEDDVSFAIHELCGKLTRQQGQRVTVQKALAEALGDWFTKHGATPPDGLKA
jgi:hypothetical protein